MAERDLVQVYPATPMDEALHKGSVRIVKWENLTDDTSDTGEAMGLEYANHTDRTVQVIGTLGTGGTITMEGSIDGTTWHTLNDPQGNALTIQTLKSEAILEATPYLRPNCTAGDGTTDLDVYVFARMNRV